MSDDDDLKRSIIDTATMTPGEVRPAVELARWSMETEEAPAKIAAMADLNAAVVALQVRNHFPVALMDSGCHWSYKTSALRPRLGKKTRVE